jgi:hypothetical protein
MNYIIQKIRLNSTQYKIQILVDNHLITFEQFTTLLHDPEFIVKFTASLLLEFDYYFETNAIKNIQTPVIIILNKIIMKGNHNFEAFKEFETHQGNVISFQNLSNDAYLVVPKPIKENINYLNLHTFLSSAPETQIIEFWIMVADTAIKYLQINDKIYLKTHGFGVPWIHFRIQKNNKYYFTKESDYNFTQL